MFLDVVDILCVLKFSSSNAVSLWESGERWVKVQYEQ